MKPAILLSRLKQEKISSSDDLSDRAVAAYLGLAIGDALGATVEFMLPSEIRHQFGVHKKIVGGGWLHLKSGQVTDDTTMALSLGNALISNRRFCSLDFANAFDQWLKSKPVDVGNTVRRGIVHYRLSGDPESPPNEFDAGNGACMRVLPLALAAFRLDDNDIRLVCNMQSHVTHNNELSDAAVFCVVRMIHMALRGDRKERLLAEPVNQLIGQFPRFNYTKKNHQNPSAYIVDTMKVVLQSFFSTDSFEECLIDVVNRGGDADTTGAIAGMIAGAYYGLEKIPARWIKSIDKEVGKRCREQALSLINWRSWEIVKNIV